MHDKLRRQWMYWQAALAAFMLYLGAANVASLQRVTVLTLQPHVEAQLNVFSLLGHDIYLDLEFGRLAAKGEDDGRRTHELGGIRGRPGMGGSIIFAGLPVVLDISINGAPYKRLSAAPANRMGAFTITRNLRTEAMVAQFRPASAGRDEGEKLVARPGLNRLSIRVVDVGTTLQGEDVELVALAPIQASGPQPGYGFFLLAFWLIPFVMAGFIGWAVWLLILDHRSGQMPNWPRR